MQLLLKSKTRYFSRGTIIADSREEATGLVVITAGQVEFWYHSLHFICTGLPMKLGETLILIEYTQRYRIFLSFVLFS
jgi:hypothetical protein